MSLRSSCEDIDGVEDELEEELGDGGNGNTIRTAATTGSFLAAEFVFPMRAVGRSEHGDGLGGGDKTNAGRGAMLLWDVRSSIDGNTLGGGFHRRAF
jgi:hypothetical protein